MNLRRIVSFMLLFLVLYSCRNKAGQATTNGHAGIAATATTLSASDSLKYLDALIKTDSLNADAWYDKGMLLASMKDTATALHALEISFSIQPLQTAGIALADLYAESKDKRALDLCNAMLKTDTARTLIDPVFIKGIYYTKTNDDKSAIAAFEECIKRDWKFTDAYIEKGIIQYNQKKIAEALKTFRLAATVSNTYPDAYFWMGRCLEALGQKKEALENYTKALALDKDFTEAAEAIKRINIL